MDNASTTASELPAHAGPLSGRLSADDLITLNEEIASMARAGLPLDQGLATLAREMRSGRLRQATAEVAADLAAGLTLDEALRRQAGRVPEFYSSLVSAGVRTGRLAEVLATLTVYARTIADMRSTVIGAVFYPAVVLVFAFALFAFMCGFIMPQFERIFRDFGLKLPVITQAAMQIGRYPGPVLVVAPSAVILGLVLARFSLRGTDAGRRAWARVLYAMPLVGTLIRSSRLAAFTDLLAILVEHALPLADAFRLAGHASSDPIMAQAARLVEQDLRDGATLGDSMRRRHLVPELIAWMTALGERRGRLAPSLRQAAEVYRRQAEMRALLLRTVLPPFLILTTAALIVGFFVFAMLMPLVKLIGELAG